uniref:F-box domain-containing protein n=2 Tax=Steinernema glaseri TaxID=37863 RepID=A0A1I7YF65_9BILA
MDTLPVELISDIIRLVNRDSQKHLCSTDSSWTPIADEYLHGEFDLSIELLIHPEGLRLGPSCLLEDRYTAKLSKADPTLRKYYVRSYPKYVEQHYYGVGTGVPFARFIQKVFALARHGRRMHLTLDIQSNGEDPPKHCELLRRLFGAIPSLPVATVDHHNCVKRREAAVEQRFQVNDLLRDLFERLDILDVPGFIPQDVFSLLQDRYTAKLSKADPALRKYYVRSYPKYVEQHYYGVGTGVPFARYTDFNTLLIDFDRLRRYLAPKLAKEKKDMSWTMCPLPCLCAFSLIILFVPLLALCTALCSYVFL